MKNKKNCANYNYWCDKLQKSCDACEEYIKKIGEDD